MRIGADALTMCVPKSIAARTQSGGCAYHGGDEKRCFAHAVEQMCFSCALGRMRLPCACRKALLRARSRADVLTMVVMKSVASRMPSSRCASHAHVLLMRMGRMRLPCACRKALLRARSRADVLTMVVMKSVASRMPSSRCASHAHWGGCAYHVRAEKHCCAHAVGRMCLPWW